MSSHGPQDGINKTSSNIFRHGEPEQPSLFEEGADRQSHGTREMSRDCHHVSRESHEKSRDRIHVIRDCYTSPRDTSRDRIEEAHKHIEMSRNHQNKISRQEISPRDSWNLSRGDHNSSPRDQVLREHQNRSRGRVSDDDEEERFVTPEQFQRWRIQEMKRERDGRQHALGTREKHVTEQQQHEHFTGNDHDLEMVSRSPKVFIVDDPKLLHQPHHPNNSNIDPHKGNSDSQHQHHYRDHRNHSPSLSWDHDNHDRSLQKIAPKISPTVSWADHATSMIPASRNGHSPSVSTAALEQATQYKHWHRYSVSPVETTRDLSKNRAVIARKDGRPKSKYYTDQQSAIDPNRRSLLDIKYEHNRAQDMSSSYQQQDASMKSNQHYHQQPQASFTLQQRLSEANTSGTSSRHSLPVGTLLEEKKLWCLTCDGEVTKRRCGHGNLVVQEREKEFPCPTCKRIFNNRSHLKRHNMIHSGEKPWACTYCEKRFNRKSHLNRHVLTHTGERPFK